MSCFEEARRQVLSTPSVWNKEEATTFVGEINDSHFKKEKLPSI